ncbi:MDR family MFS transporter [Streptomyces phaeochromogenes]|uniref:MDR family MFS transporter n=1 Tax=Streptomyces phaeochromogenes TaxID=1923 RepID=UPI002DD7FC92|nr:MDR family MFS transporter [Streptomyces phaeochromogenes]WRZ34661.1 DHA2 family efflux MFS transporter permease subunit [Streptomyces phaeochromogenes]
MSSSTSQSNGITTAGADSFTPRPNLIIGLLVSSAFVMILNETIMSVALPDLIVDLSITATTAQWLTSGFLLTMAVVVPVTGYLIQRFPPRAMYQVSMGLFILGTAIAAAAPGFTLLLTGRIVQAAGTAIMLPLLTTTLLILIPAGRRGRAMGTISIVVAVAPAVGPTLSGIILSALSWRWMFILVLPLAVIALVGGMAKLRVPAKTHRIPLDLASIVLSAVGFSGLVYGLSSMGESARARAVLPIVVGLLALTVFVFRQLRLQRHDRALLDLRPFRGRVFVVAVILMVLSMMSLFGAMVLLPLYMQDVLGVGTRATGLALLPGGLVMGLLAPLVGRLFDRWGPQPLVLPGAVVLCIALWLFTTLGESSSLAAVVTFHVVLSVGIALMLTPLLADALGSLPDALYSHGSAIVTTLQQVAGATGTALFVTVMTSSSASAAATADAAGIRAAFLVAATLSIAAIVAALFVRGNRSTAPRPTNFGH